MVHPTRKWSATLSRATLEKWQLGLRHAYSVWGLPIVSIVVPFWGYLIRILIIYLVKPKKGTTMETIGRALGCQSDGAQIASARL